MLLSNNDEDFELGKTILEGLGIKPSCLLNYNTKQSLKSDFKFKMVAGELKRYNLPEYPRYWSTMPIISSTVDNIQNIKIDEGKDN